MNHGMFCSSLPKRCHPLILHGPMQMFTSGDWKGHITVEVKVHRGVTSVQSLWEIPLQLEAEDKGPPGSIKICQGLRVFKGQ